MIVLPGTGDDLTSKVLDQLQFLYIGGGSV